MVGKKKDVVNRNEEYMKKPWGNCTINTVSLRTGQAIISAAASGPDVILLKKSEMAWGLEDITLQEEERAERQRVMER